VSCSLNCSLFATSLFFSFVFYLCIVFLYYLTTTSWWIKIYIMGSCSTYQTSRSPTDANSSVWQIHIDIDGSRTGRQTVPYSWTGSGKRSISESHRSSGNIHHVEVCWSYVPCGRQLVQQQGTGEQDCWDTCAPALSFRRQRIVELAVSAVISWLVRWVQFVVCLSSAWR